MVRFSKPRNPCYYLLKTKKGIKSRRAFVKPRSVIVGGKAPVKKVLQKKFKAYLRELRNPPKIKLLAVPERKQGELVSKWERKNKFALDHNRRVSWEFWDAKNTGADTALVCEHIAHVLQKSPNISGQDIGRAVLESLKSAGITRTIHVSCASLTTEGVRRLLIDLIKKGIIAKV